MNASAELKTFGLLRIGPALIGIEVAALQEVFPCPPRLQFLPASAPAVRGAVLLRDLVIPVLDLRQMLHLDGDKPVGDVVVVIRHEDRLLGVLADAVQGMASIVERDLRGLDVRSGDGSAIASHAAQVASDLVVVLDIARLARHDGIPWVQAGDGRAGSQQSAEPSELLLLFRCGPFPLAISAAAVASTAPGTAVRESAVGRAPCLGVLHFQGVDVPVLDLPALLGLAPAARARPEQTAALLLKCHPEDARQTVALTVDRVCDMSRIRRRDILPRPAAGLSRPELFRGVIDWVLDGGGTTSCLLLDDAALTADGLVQALAGMSRAGPDAGSDRVPAGGTAATGRLPPALTFHIGHELAVPLVHVAEIIPMRPDLVPTASCGGPIVGVITHRGRVTSLVDLAQALGQPPVPCDEQSRVLLVREGPHQLGFIVHRLGTMDACRWRAPGRELEPAFDAADFRRRPPLVEIGSAGNTRTLALLDLAGLTRSLLRVA